MLSYAATGTQNRKINKANQEKCLLCALTRWPTPCPDPPTHIPFPQARSGLVWEGGERGGVGGYIDYVTHPSYPQARAGTLTKWPTPSPSPLPLWTERQLCLKTLRSLKLHTWSIIKLTAAVAPACDEDLHHLVVGLQIDRQPRGVLVVGDAARSLLHVTVRASVHSVRRAIVLKLRALPGWLVLGEIFKCWKTKNNATPFICQSWGWWSFYDIVNCLTRHIYHTLCYLLTKLFSSKNKVSFDCLPIISDSNSIFINIHWNYVLSPRGCPWTFKSQMARDPHDPR